MDLAGIAASLQHVPVSPVFCDQPFHVNEGNSFQDGKVHQGQIELVSPQRPGVFPPVIVMHLIVGIDGLKEAVQSILEGSIAATVFNNPRMGAITFATIEKYGLGQHIEPVVVVKGPLIDRSNAAAMIADAI